MAGLLLVALVIALNGFFVAAEFALVKLRATRETAASPAVAAVVARLAGRDALAGVLEAAAAAAAAASHAAVGAAATGETQ